MLGVELELLVVCCGVGVSVVDVEEATVLVDEELSLDVIVVVGAGTELVVAGDVETVVVEGDAVVLDDAAVLVVVALEVDTGDVVVAVVATVVVCCCFGTKK